ncbi:Uncharacterised protein [uncultured archaeon]|nr:Uncharacterised protein [uncultured archaeon]
MSNIRRSIIILAAILLVINNNSAKPNVVEVGPFIVSFDMGDVGPYRIEMLPIKEMDTYSGAQFTTYTFIINDTSQDDRPLTTHKRVVFTIDDGITFRKADIISTYDKYKYFVTLYNRTIDNNEGVLVVLDFLSLQRFSFMYPLGNDVSVGADSFYPWEEGTSNLLRTVHVERDNKKR